MWTLCSCVLCFLVFPQFLVFYLQMLYRFGVIFDFNMTSEGVTQINQMTLCICSEFHLPPVKVKSWRKIQEFCLLCRNKIYSEIPALSIKYPSWLRENPSVESLFQMLLSGPDPLPLFIPTSLRNVFISDCGRTTAADCCTRWKGIKRRSSWSKVAAQSFTTANVMTNISKVSSYVKKSEDFLSFWS